MWRSVAWPWPYLSPASLPLFSTGAADRSWRGRGVCACIGLVSSMVLVYGPSRNRSPAGKLRWLGRILFSAVVAIIGTFGNGDPGQDVSFTPSLPLNNSSPYSDLYFPSLTLVGSCGSSRVSSRSEPLLIPFLFVFLPGTSDCRCFSPKILFSAIYC